MAAFLLGIWLGCSVLVGLIAIENLRLPGAILGSSSDQAAQIAEARQRSEASVRAAKEQIAIEAATARQTLDSTSGQIADEIATAVLARRAA